MSNARYNIGDTFIATVTEVNGSGMGILYELNGNIALTEKQIDTLEIYTPVETDNKAKKAKVTYTPEDLKKRVWMLSKLLAETIEKLEKVNREVNESVSIVDQVIEEIKGE